jgi:hypothetical protein
MIIHRAPARKKFIRVFAVAIGTCLLASLASSASADQPLPCKFSGLDKSVQTVVLSAAGERARWVYPVPAWNGLQSAGFKSDVARIDVKLQTRTPTFLYLTSPRPTEWVVAPENADFIFGIILAGKHPQTIRYATARSTFFGYPAQMGLFEYGGDRSLAPFVRRLVDSIPDEPSALTNWLVSDMTKACNVEAPLLETPWDNKAPEKISIALQAMTGRGFDRFIDHASPKYLSRVRDGTESSNPAVFTIN